MAPLSDSVDGRTIVIIRTLSKGNMNCIMINYYNIYNNNKEELREFT